jgi:septal ring-binding cell division protein DamX
VATPQRTVSNWRERRPVSAPAPQPEYVPPPAPHLVPRPAPEFDPATAETTIGDDGEDGRAARTRMIAGAVVVVAAIIAAVVVFSTGMFGKDRGTHAGPATAETGAPLASSSTGAVQDPVATPAPVVPKPTFGLQVASFKTAGRATRVLDELKDQTKLRGEILTTEDPDGNTWYRIVLGRFDTEATAQTAAQDLVGRSLIPEAIVIPYTPREP